MLVDVEYICANEVGNCMLRTVSIDGTLQPVSSQLIICCDSVYCCSSVFGSLLFHVVSYVCMGADCLFEEVYCSVRMFSGVVVRSLLVGLSVLFSGASICV